MTSESYTIRPARADDADAVAEMWLEMAEEHAAYDSQRWEWAEDAGAKWRSHFLERLEKEDCFTLVAVDTVDRTVGFVTARMSDPAPVFAAGRGASITNLVVKSEYRRQGIGKRLTEAILEILKSCDAQSVTLGVACANEPAIGLYRDLGFRDVMRQLQKEL